MGEIVYPSASLTGGFYNGFQSLVCTITGYQYVEDGVLCCFFGCFFVSVCHVVFLCYISWNSSKFGHSLRLERSSSYLFSSYLFFFSLFRHFFSHFSSIIKIWGLLLLSIFLYIVRLMGSGKGTGVSMILSIFCNRRRTDERYYDKYDRAN